MYCFAVARAKEPGIHPVNMAQLTRGNVLCSDYSLGCKGLFMANAEGESNHSCQF